MASATAWPTAGSPREGFRQHFQDCLDCNFLHSLFGWLQSFQSTCKLLGFLFCKISVITYHALTLVNKCSFFSYTLYPHHIIKLSNYDTITVSQRKSSQYRSPGQNIWKALMNHYLGKGAKRYVTACGPNSHLWPSDHMQQM